MIEWATWASVAILGPGSILVFAWFLWDLKRILGKGEGEDEPDRGKSA